MADMPTIRFSAERRRDLERLGVTDEQISEVEAVLPLCALHIKSSPQLTDTRVVLNGLIEALCTVRKVFSASPEATREALNRWMMAAHAHGHPFGSDHEFMRKLDLGTLIESAREAKGQLGTDQRRSHAATSKPIQLIDEALVRGWGKTLKDRAVRADEKGITWPCALLHAAAQIPRYRTVCL